MDPQAELRIVRAAYAKQILAAANTIDPRLTEAFAAIPREHFVGPGPWSDAAHPRHRNSRRALLAARGRMVPRLQLSWQAPDL
ncbi:hypothetical protein RX327_03480 [Bradyrhizobium sp. BEA-2-5]|uniref:hypothetical protein n=1 Tax=Bradyrhizobium TaxID=374 RepID=UPI00067DE813|nr:MULTISPECIES: hypothetical protein [Bradyrhizobium]WOH82266.1 hypothetical protein RX327_03480 [Bradyrhizobium sp. BEA-2-5]